MTYEQLKGVLLHEEELFHKNKNHHLIEKKGAMYAEGRFKARIILNVLFQIRDRRNDCASHVTSRVTQHAIANVRCKKMLEGDREERDTERRKEYKERRPERRDHSGSRSRRIRQSRQLRVYRQWHQRRRMKSMEIRRINSPSQMLRRQKDK